MPVDDFQHRLRDDATPTRAPTVAAGVTSRLIEQAIGCGLSAGPLLDIVGWSSAAPPSCDARVHLDQQVAVWEHVARGPIPRDFGLRSGAALELDDLGVLGMLMSQSTTIADAFAQQARFRRLLFDLPLVATRVEPGKLVVEYDLPPRLAALRHVAEAGLAFWLTLTRRLAGAHLHAIRVELPHPAPADRTAHVRLFGVEPHFERARPRIELPGDVWRHRVATCRTKLDHHLEARAVTLLRRLPPLSDDAAGVREFVGVALRHARQPTLVGAARRLSLSTRTLQRRLREAGVSFDALVDETRRELALIYLGEDRLTIGEIVVVLGYSEAATFYRAFKRWTATTPAAYRAQRH